MAQASNSYNRSRQKRKRRRKKRTQVIIARLIFAVFIVTLVTLIVLGVNKIYNTISERVSPEVTVTTINVAKNGTIKETIIEEFNPGFYDEESLKDDVEKRIDAAGGSIRSDGIEFDDGVATLTLKYDSDDDVAAFNDEVFYADTIDSLIDQGVNFDSEAVKAGGSHAVIVSEALDIRCPKKILYTGGAVAIDEDDEKLAHCTTPDGTLAFVID